MRIPKFIFFALLLAALVSVKPAAAGAPPPKPGSPEAATAPAATTLTAAPAPATPVPAAAVPKKDEKKPDPRVEVVLYSTIHNDTLCLARMRTDTGQKKFLSHRSEGFSSTFPLKNAGDDFSAAPSPDGKWISFYSSRGGAVNLWMCDVSGRDQRQLTTGDTDINHFDPTLDGQIRFSPDSKHIAYISLGNIWLYNLEEDTHSSLTGGGDVDMLEWSLSGKNIAYVRRSSVRIVAAKGAPDEVAQQNVTTWPTLSWLESSLLYFDKGAWQVDMESKRSLRLFGSLIIPNRIQVSPDKKSVCLIGESPDLSPEVFLIGLEKKGKKEQLTRGGASFPVFSTDSKKIYFLRNNMLWRINTDSNGITQLTLNHTFLPAVGFQDLSQEGE